MDKQQVWVRDPVEGFILGMMNELLPDEAEIIPLDKRYPKRTCTFEDIYPCGEYTKDVEDNCKYLNVSKFITELHFQYNLFI